MTSEFVERLAQAEYDYVSSRGQFFDPRPTWAEQVDLVRDTYRGRVRRQIEAMHDPGEIDSFQVAVDWTDKGNRLVDISDIWKMVLAHMLEDN